MPECSGPRRNETYKKNSKGSVPENMWQMYSAMAWIQKNQHDIMELVSMRSATGGPIYLKRTKMKFFAESSAYIPCIDQTGEK